MTARILAIANQKGGVGKTTTAVNLATSLAAVGKKVLLIDLDPQGNASTGLGIDRKSRSVSTYDLLFGGASAGNAAVKTRVPGLWVVPASVHLAGADIELVTAERREFRLREALRGEGGQGQSADFDYILIDCPPSLSLITLNALIAADGVMVPLQCEFYALEGLSQLVRTIERVKATFNPALEIQGVVLTMYDKRNNLSEQVANDVRAFFGPKVYTTIIPRNVRMSEAPSHGLPAIVYDMRCPGSQAYIQLAKEMLKRERGLAEPVAA